LELLPPAIRSNGSSSVTVAALSLDDSELLERARNAYNAATLRLLWAGDFSDYPSQSEADLALCAILAFWTARDPGRIDSLFRESGLMRPKRL